MTKKILIAGFACWSVIAVAQSNSSSGQSGSDPASSVQSSKATKGASSQDVAQGHPSGKRQHEPVSSVSAPTTGQDAAKGEVAKGQASGSTSADKPNGGKTAIDDWAGKAATAPNGNKSGHDDWANSTVKNSSGGNASSSAADMNQDGAADRSSAPASPKPQSRVATGDVNGDGRADATVSNSGSKNQKDAASAQASGKRMHQPATVTKVSDTTPQK